jgi:hypothetical protein
MTYKIATAFSTAVICLLVLKILGCKSDDSPYKPHAVKIQWSKYAANPVIQKSNMITEFFAIGQPTCLFENDTIKLWYVAGGLPYITTRLLYATSTDGINWTKYGAGASLMEGGGPGSWDVCIDTPEIVRDSSGYKLYYLGDTLPGGSNQLPSGRASIGVATSPDGINWTKYSGNPILTHGGPDSWECSWIESPAVLWDSTAGIYMMWYSGVDTNGWTIGIGLATSPDGFIWTKYPGNPVLSHGPSGSYDDMWVAVPSVIRTARGYEMWFSVFSSITAYGNIAVNYATSSDGVNWTKFSGNPLFSTNSPPHNMAIDSAGPWAPDVIFNGEEYMMWYETVAGFSLATSTGQIIEF